MKKRWSKLEEQILKLNYQKMPRQELIKLLPERTKGSLSVKARQFGLTNYEGNYSWHSTITYNKSFFKEINSNSCYWAGFIAADGYLNNKNNKIRIKLALKDLIQLKEFSLAINFSGAIREYVRDTNVGKSYPTCYLDLCGAKEMIEDLKNNFNISSPKSLTLKSPYYLKFSQHKLAFLKGLIDGDGSINKKGDRFEVLVSENIGYWIIQFMQDLDYSVNLRKKKETKGLYVAYKTNVDLMYLIKNSSSFGLERKWSRLPY